MLEWVAMSSSRDRPDPGIKPRSSMFPALASGFFITCTTWEAQSGIYDHSNKIQSSILSDSMKMSFSSLNFKPASK